MTITCISLIGTLKIKAGKTDKYGKRQLNECGKVMSLVNHSFIWECPLGHKRIWPPQEIDLLKSSPFKTVPLKIFGVHYESESYKAALLFLIHMYSYTPQNHDS